MRIQSPSVVSLTWKLADAQGQEIDELTAPVEFFFGGDDLLAKVEEALDGQSTGYTTTLKLEPADAFGEYDAGLVFFEPRGVLPEGIDAGMAFEGPPPGATTPGLDPDTLYTVTEVYPEHVVLDGNHPLAGIGLVLSLTVHDVREATEEEVEAGSVGLSAVNVLASATPPPRLH